MRSLFRRLSRPAPSIPRSHVARSWRIQTLHAATIILITRTIQGLFRRQRRTLAAFVKKIHATSQMRDHNRPTHNQPHVECFPDLRIRAPGADALIDVVRNAVVAPQHQRRNEPQEFLRLLIKPARCGRIPIRLVIERKETLGDERAAAGRRLLKDPLVQTRPELLKLFVA